MNLDPRSLSNLNGVHEDLRKVVALAAQMLDGSLSFVVTEGVRTLEKQKSLFRSGATRTMNSRHLTGHAVDLAAKLEGEIRWDFPLYTRLASAMKDAARDLGIRITWGGDWSSFKDGPHFELTWDAYPVAK